jgi:hypothetical protein
MQNCKKFYASKRQISAVYIVKYSYITWTEPKVVYFCSNLATGPEKMPTTQVGAMDAMSRFQHH